MSNTPQTPAAIPPSEPAIPAFAGPPDQRPSAEEWLVRWNVAPLTQEEVEDLEEFYREIGYDELPEEPPGLTYVYSRQPPQSYDVELDFDDNVKEELQKEVPAYLHSAKISQTDEYGDPYFDDLSFQYRGEVISLIYPLDRTIETALMTPDVFTPGLIRHIQHTVLHKYPLWRMHVVETTRDGERGLTIYADVVRVGDALCPPADLDTTIASWQEHIRRIRESRDGPKRQALYVRRLLPEVLPTVPKNGAALIAVFDNCQGDYQTTNAWIAYDKAYEDGKKPLYEDELDRPYSKDVNPVPPYRPGAIGKFYSDVEGNINADVTSHLPYEIGQCLLPPDEEVMLTIRHKESGRTQQFTIRRSDSITDAELKRLLGDE